MSEEPEMPRPVLWRQIVLGLLLFGVYLVVDSLNDASRRAAARQHGRDIYALEQHLHVDVERTLNAWLAPHHTLSTLANYEYAYTYILSALALMAWVLVRRPDLWRVTRDSFIVLNLIAIGTFALYPAAPPRVLPDLGYVDTVSRGGTIGSWGSGLVDTANQIAAMPSLHIGWALWVSVVLARITAGRRAQLVSAVHVLLTLYVVMATANHFLLDAVAVVLPVLVAVRLAEWLHRPEGEVVASCDAFFLHVEGTGAAQHVGGFIVFGPDEGMPRLADIRELARTDLLPRPRFQQKLSQPSRWRRLRWVDTEVDLDWHVTEMHSTDGERGMHAIVAELAEQPMPRDRPLWRLVVVRDVGGGRSGYLILVHHAMADGIGTIGHALALFRPRVELPTATGGPGLLQRAAAVSVGLAQLATDGGARPLGESSARRQYATGDLDLDAVRRVADAHGVRVTDLVLAMVADGVRTTRPELVAASGGTLRASVTRLVRAPGGAQGNATAAVMVEVPLDDRPLDELVAEIARRTVRLKRPTRAMASRFVMATGLRVLPEPAADWFARTVYGGRFFHAVVSNLPGPTDRLTLGDTRVDRVLPILPVAPGAPLSLGAMSWAGVLGLGIATDPALLDGEALAVGMLAAAERLGAVPEGGRSVVPRPGPGEGEEEAGALAG